MKKIEKLSVTVAVSAYNEEVNIKSFISSVLEQEETFFNVDKFLIISDGSTDNTVKIAESFKSTKIVVKKYKRRLGKSTRLNEIYELLESDFLVQSDCDVIFAHPFVIRDILLPFINDKRIGMCGGNPFPINGVTYVEKAVNYMNEVFINFRNKVDVFSADGRLLAYRKNLVKKISVPTDMIANDVYTYYCCLKSGYKYKFVPSAMVYFRSPQTIKDYVRQTVRFSAAPIRMKTYFNKSIVEKETYISLVSVYKCMLGQFIKHPISFTTIFVLSKYCQYIAIKNERRLIAVWDMANSTKKLN